MIAVLTQSVMNTYHLLFYALTPPPSTHTSRPPLPPSPLCHIRREARLSVVSCSHSAVMSHPECNLCGVKGQSIAPRTQHISELLQSVPTCRASVTMVDLSIQEFSLREFVQ